MNGTTQKVFTILLVDDNGGDVEMFLRTVEEELPREEDEQVELVLAACGRGLGDPGRAPDRSGYHRRPTTRNGRRCGRRVARFSRRGSRSGRRTI